MIKIQRDSSGLSYAKKWGASKTSHKPSKSTNKKTVLARQLLKIKMTLLGAGTVRPRTAELRDVFSATAFSSQRLVKVAVFMLLKRHQHIQVQS